MNELTPPRPPAGSHVRHDLGSARPAPHRGVRLELWRWLCVLVMMLGRFRIAGDFPALPKAVIIAAPHTSNWDAVWMLAAAGRYRVALRWMGKKSLAEGPLGWLARAFGVVPVDRGAAADMVGTMAATFARSDALLLAVAPEGTRGSVREWKTGFWHIARAAEVPLIFAVMDYGCRTVKISGHMWPTDDYAADLALIRTHYAQAEGRRRERFDVTAARPRDGADPV